MKFSYLIKFPVFIRRKIWLEACGYKNFGDVAVNYKICKLHFTPHNFTRRGNLKSYAVPIPSTQVIDGPSDESGSREPIPRESIEMLNDKDPVEVDIDRSGSRTVFCEKVDASEYDADTEYISL